MTTKAGAKSEIDVLLKAARANGYKTVPAAGGHRKIVDHRGKPVVDGDGPLILSSSPSDFRWREMTVKRWLAAKVLDRDPFESQTKVAAVERKLSGGAVSGKGGRSRLTDPDVKEAKVAAIKARNAELRGESLKVREKLEPLIVKLGGWSKYGVKAQFGQTMQWWLEWRGKVERFPSISASSSALHNLSKGNALTDNNRIAIESFVDELLKAPDPVKRYFELVRLSKGLSATEEIPLRGGTPLSDPPSLEEREEQAERAKSNGKGQANRIGPATKPSLALEAVALMMIGRDELDERVLKLGEQIQEMELRERGMVT